MITYDEMWCIIEYCVKNKLTACLECTKCGKKTYTIAGNAHYLYEKMYSKGCKCGGTYKFYASDIDYEV